MKRFNVTIGEDIEETRCETKIEIILIGKDQLGWIQWALAMQITTTAAPITRKTRQKPRTRPAQSPTTLPMTTTMSTSTQASKTTLAKMSLIQKITQNAIDDIDETESDEPVYSKDQTEPIAATDSALEGPMEFNLIDFDPGTMLSNLGLFHTIEFSDSNSFKVHMQKY